MESSKKYKLNKTDAKKIATGAGIAAGGAVVTYLLQVLTQIDFGQMTPVIVSIASILLNALRKLLQEKSDSVL